MKLTALEFKKKKIVIACASGLFQRDANESVEVQPEGSQSWDMMGCRRAGATWATGATRGKDMVMEQIQKEAAAPVKVRLTQSWVRG